MVSEPAMNKSVHIASNCDSVEKTKIGCVSMKGNRRKATDEDDDDNDDDNDDDREKLADGNWWDMLPENV